MTFRILGLLLLLLAFGGTASAAELNGPAEVVDGDTLDVGGQRVRLFGIDAIESLQFCRRGGRFWDCGRDSAEALRLRIGGLPVSCRGKGTDRFGRLVATCYSGGEDINGWMVQQGWALAFRRYSDVYAAREAEARAQRRGVWSSSFEPPWEWRQRFR